ncbi:hypothetical protein CWI38_2672p0010 [Hamiltosporidium tvaerminnensis]|uniref:RRM domain-containing protein n=1 Tax=Hamiltosporidium tvaerminnensis TaxID=1176355 RepID=A0A4Q9LG94_9MICR|nr:hypothetical protein CWI38_2672p0010 [Hamiltosporidium tvaerminnensis]
MENIEKQKNTLYISNINQNMNIKEIKRRLLIMFSRFTKIKDISISNRLKMRGQAFISIEESIHVEKCMEMTHGRYFMGKRLIVQYALHETGRKKSDSTNKLKKQIQNDINPTKTLVIRNFDKSIGLNDIIKIFSESKGYLTVRYVSVKQIAFIDFDTPKNALMAYKNLFISIFETFGHQIELKFL